MSVTVQTGARLHVTLLDLGTATSRIYGGAGFAVTGPLTRASVEAASDWSIKFPPTLDPRAQSDIAACVERVSVLTPLKANITFRCHAEQHVGLGSKTSVLMAVRCQLSQ